MKRRFKGIHIVSKFFTSLFSAGKATAVTIFPFVFYSNRFIAAKQTIRTHETIHIYQQLECSLAGGLIVISGVFFFDRVLVFLPAAFLYYILYGLFYAINLVKYKDRYDAYRNIPFEKEAWKKENQPEYIVFRKLFSWMKEL